jgi:hypothetical protein
MKELPKILVSRNGEPWRECTDDDDFESLKLGELMLVNPPWDIPRPSSADLAELRDLDEQITALRDRWSNFLAANWEPEVRQARLAFRENPSLEGVDRLYAILRDKNNSSPFVIAVSETIRCDIEQAACTLFRRCRNKLVAFLTFAHANATRALDERRYREEAWRQKAAELVTGPLPPSAECERLAKRALAIHKAMDMALDETRWRAQHNFPPSIAALLATAGISLNGSAIEPSAEAQPSPTVVSSEQPPPGPERNIKMPPLYSAAQNPGAAQAS